MSFVEDLYETTPEDKRSPFLLAFIADMMLENIENQTAAEESAERAKKVSYQKNYFFCISLLQLYKTLQSIDPVRINYYKHQSLLAQTMIIKSQTKVAAK